MRCSTANRRRVAFRFDLYPGAETTIEVSATLFPRKADVKFGLAPLTSMFFLGENERRSNEDFRPELHDSDGLLIHSATGEWIWRPLRNPPKPEISSFLDRDIRGFGLLQRDRDFGHYQDLDLAYEMRPGYFVEPRDSWGEGHIDLVELPTEHETNDNIVASFAPKDTPEPNKPFSYGYRLSASLDLTRLSPQWARAQHLSDDGGGARLRRSDAQPDRGASSSISTAATSPITPRIRNWSRSSPRPARARSCGLSLFQTATSKAFAR